MEEDDNDEEEQDETPNEPVNYVCPVCEDAGEEVIFESLRLLAAHYNWRHKSSSTPGFTEIKNRIRTTSKPPAPRKEEKEPEQKPSRKPKEKGVKMSDVKEEHIAPELGDAARVRGIIRQLLMAVGEKDKTVRNALLPEREQLVELLNTLTLKNITSEDIQAIEFKVETDIAPTIRTICGESKKTSDQNDSDDDASENPNMDLQMKKEQLRSNIKRDLLIIAELPSELQDPVSAERSMLIELNRRLVKDNITKKELNEIDAQYTSIRPFITAAAKKSRRNKKDGDDDDFDDDFDDDSTNRALKRMKLKLKRTQYLRELKEEQLALDKLDQNPLKQNGPLQMIAVPRPKTDPQTGQIIMGEDGQPMMETTYQYATSTGMDPLMQTMFQTMLASLLNRGGHDEIGKLMLEMKKEELDWRKYQLELESKKGNTGSEEIKEIRNMNQQLMQQFYQTQLNQMQKDLNNARAYANRDPLDDLVEQKQKLMTLGIVTDPRMATQEQQATQYARDTLHEASSKIDQTLHDLKEMAHPFIEVNAEILRKRAEQMGEPGHQGPQQPRRPQGTPNPQEMTQEEQIERWNNILHTIDNSGGE